MIYLIIGFIIYLIIFGFYSGFILYHLQEFGYLGDATRPMTIFYLTFAITLILVSVAILVIGRSLYA